MNFIHDYHSYFCLFVKYLIATVYLRKQTRKTHSNKLEAVMKVFLQPEAKTISDREIELNQQYLVDSIGKVFNFANNLSRKTIQLLGFNCQH